MKPLFALTILLTSAVTSVQADTVILNNGDRITGTVVKKETSVLVFKTPYAGKINIQWSDVAELKTDQPISVVLENDTALEQASFAAKDKGVAKVSAENVDTPMDISLAKIKYINPSAAVSGKGVKVKGRVNIGISVASGNSDNETINADTEIIIRSKTNRFTIGGNTYSTKDNGADTEDKSLAYLKYDHFLNKKRYIYGTTSFANDKFKDQKLKSTVGLGYGHQFIETDDRNLAVEAGINYVNDDFYVAADDNYAAGRWAIKYDEKFFKKRVQLFHNQEGLVDVSDTENITISAQTGFRFPILEGMNAGLQLNIDWDKTPPTGTKSTDRKVLFNVGYSW